MLETDWHGDRGRGLTRAGCRCGSRQHATMHNNTRTALDVEIEREVSHAHDRVSTTFVSLAGRRSNGVLLDGHFSIQQTTASLFKL